VIVYPDGLEWYCCDRRVNRSWGTEEHRDASLPPLFWEKLTELAGALGDTLAPLELRY
jgi:hypothetical protein